MKVTGGKRKGRLLVPIKGLNIRPTSSKVRESIFNIIGQDVSGLRILDLFAGTGCLGIEALSRGASWALFIDNMYRSIELIKKNLVICGFEKSGFVLKKDLLMGLPLGHPLLKEGIDLMFIDPPYGKNIIPPILEKISEGKILTSSAIVVTESLKGDNLPVRVKKLVLLDSRIYGETKLNIYQSEDV
jgi:16S rRNA (guanine966-N2)-methyltransferase